jgi:hypothetical protein
LRIINYPSAKLLIDNGAKIEIEDNQGKTPDRTL